MTFSVCVCVSFPNIYTMCWIVLSVICSWHSVASLSVPAAYVTRCSLPPNAIFHQGNPTADKLIRRISSHQSQAQKLKVWRIKEKARFLGFCPLLFLCPNEISSSPPSPKILGSRFFWSWNVGFIRSLSVFFMSKWSLLFQKSSFSTFSCSL